MRACRPRQEVRSSGGEGGDGRCDGAVPGKDLWDWVPEGSLAGFFWVGFLGLGGPWGL